jgi:hypothetical protein
VSGREEGRSPNTVKKPFVSYQNARTGEAARVEEVRMRPENI